MLVTNIVHGKRYKYPYIVVGMTDEDVIQSVANMFGNKVHQVDFGHRSDGIKGKPIFRATISGQRAAAFMVALLPWMGKRRSAKIKEILAHQEERPDPNDLRREWSSVKAKTKPRDGKGRFR